MGFCQTQGVVFQVSVAASAYCAACRLRLNSTHVAARPQAAAHDIHRPGAALLPLTCTSQVAIAGVKPPKSAVARLYASEKPVVRILAGMISVGAMIFALTEIMPAKIRTTGFSLAYSLATALFGGFTPAIATWLVHVSGNKAAPGLWMSCAAACGLAATCVLFRRSRQAAQYAEAATLT